MSGIVEIFLSATLEPFIQKLGSETIQFLTNHKRVKSSFEKLTSDLNHILSVLEDAEKRQYTEASVKNWLASLRDFAFDLEDLLDDIMIQGEKRHCRRIIYNPLKIVPNMINDHKMMSKISDITDRLQKIREQVNDLKIISRKRGGPDDVFQKNVTRASKPHMLKEDYLVGRDDKKKEIIKMIMESNDLVVIPIVGMGGIGKTTLAKSVYYDSQVQKHFEIQAMACISTNLNILEVTQTIYHQVFNNEPGSKNIHILQEELQKKLANTKFLIVLDDVWTEDYLELDALICPFKGQSGGRIIVTTRNEDVAKIVKYPRQLSSVHVEKLNDEDCLSLMLHHAKISLQDFPEFESVADQLMRRCNRLPLAAKSLGGILLSKDSLKDWNEVLQSNIWNLPNVNILPILRLSYFDLPPHLKRMFSYCALFPQDYKFKKRELVLLWTGEGFLDQHIDTETKTKEEWGDECFDELVKKSFFQCSSHDDTFVMHDLINDLACHIATETSGCWDKKKSLEKVRRCSIHTRKYESLSELKDFQKAKKLRTLLLLKRWDFTSHMSNEILPTLLPKLHYITVLCLSRCHFGELPDSICVLTHLRYLDLSYSSITTLPNSLGCLIRLEMLSIAGTEIFKLPETLGNLRYLRHLDNSNIFFTDLECIIPCEFGKLEHLQTLPEVGLSKGRSLGLKELQNLKNLGGSLTICRLENVISIEGLDACLKEKKKLHELKLGWNTENEHVSDEDVLERLCPPKDLRRLEIYGFKGLGFPSWLGDSSYTTLSDISLTNCENCTCLPPLGQLSNLVLLKIWRMDKITCIGDEFYGYSGASIPFSKLESLSLSSMPNLKKWRISYGGEGHVFSNLKQLQIEDCEKLDVISPLFLDSLQRLTLCNCSVAVLESFRKLGHLTTFVARKVSGLCHLPRELVESFSFLREFRISHCHELEYLWPQDTILEHVTSLEITHCDKLVTFLEMGMPPSLKRLRLGSCGKLSGLFQQQHSGFQNLVELTLSDCNTIECLQFLPPNLKHLQIANCASLRSLPSHISTPLGSLYIFSCHQLDNFPSFVFPPTLRTLIVGNCSKLKPLKEWGLGSLPYLQSFYISGGFPELHQLSDDGDTCRIFPSSLESLTMERFPKLVSLGNTLENVTSLRSLKIERCEKLGELPSERVLGNLHEITIYSCPSLKINFQQGSIRERVLQKLHQINIRSCPSLQIKFPKGSLRDYLVNQVGIPDVTVHFH